MKQNKTTLFTPQEMLSPFDAIKEKDGEGREWWNSRKLARLLGYQKYWNFERLMDKVAPFLQKEKGLNLDEHMVEIEEMAQLNNGGYRQVKSVLLSRTACLALAMNADAKKPLVQAARDYFASQMTSTELATSVEGNVLMYRSTTGKVNVSVVFNNETFWLLQKRMAELFAVTVPDINYHLKQIDESGELQLSAAIKKILISSDNCDNQPVLMYNQKEVESLNLLTTAFLDMAEDRARRHLLTKMADWKTYLEKYLNMTDRDVLQDAGSISHEEAEAKAIGEYEKFRRIQDRTILSDFDKFIEGIK